jgi:hypothetical protein
MLWLKRTIYVPKGQLTIMNRSEAYERFIARLVSNKKGQHDDHFYAIAAANGLVNVIEVGVASAFLFYYIRITILS